MDSASDIHVTLMPLSSLQGLEDTTFSFGTSLSHTYAPTSEMRNWLVLQIAFTETHADLPFSVRHLRKTHLISFAAFTP